MNRQDAKSAKPGAVQDEFLAVLTDVAHQVLRGKGRERHNGSAPFEDAPVWRILDLCGEGFAAGQAMKKVNEALGLLKTRGCQWAVPLAGDRQAAVNEELLGAMAYLALLVAWRRART